jgi:hypothetical protein
LSRSIVVEYRTTKDDDARRRETLAIRSELAKRILTFLGEREDLEAPHLGLTLVKRTSPVPPTPYLYDPSLAMIIRGRKRVILGNSTYWYDESLFLLTAVNLPPSPKSSKRVPRTPTSPSS